MTFTELFKTILTADKDKSRKAARRVRGFLYSSHSEGESIKTFVHIIENAPEEYAKIKEDWRQENFVIAISIIYYLHNRENQPDFLFPWFFQLLQNKNGNIRHAVVRMIQHELGSLTYHIRFLGRESGYSGLSKKQADGILLGLRADLDSLAANSWKQAYKKYKYVDELPSGTYKSIELILSLLDDYCNDAANKTETQYESPVVQHPSSRNFVSLRDKKLTTGQAKQPHNKASSQRGGDFQSNLGKTINNK